MTSLLSLRQPRRVPNPPSVRTPTRKSMMSLLPIPGKELPTPGKELCSTVSLNPIPRVIPLFAAALVFFGASGVISAQCPVGPLHGSQLAGDLGPAPVGAYVEIACLEITNDRSVARSGETAFSSIPIPRTLNLVSVDQLALVGPGNRRLAAQFDVVSRWGQPVDSAATAIRWLAVSVSAEVAANDLALYSLRRYDSLAVPADAFAASIVPQGALFVVDTGVATFTLDPANPALLEQVAIDEDNDGTGVRTVVYGHTGGAGPRLAFDPDQNDATANDLTLTTAVTSQVTLDAGSFEIVEDGPLRVSVAIRGHFSSGTAATLCDPGIAAPYERFGYTAVFTFTRGRRDVDLQFQFRNECSSALSGPWDDEAALLRRVSWELPLTVMAPITSYLAGSAAVVASSVGFGGVTLVEQERGSQPGGGAFVRSATARLDVAIQESAVTFDRPIVAIDGANLLASLQVPWMRYREPQAVAIDGTTLSLRLVSDSLRIGEGKGIWGFGRFTLVPATLVSSGTATFLEAQRQRVHHELERGLLVRAPRELVNASGVLPGLGSGAISTVKSNYQAWLGLLHDETVLPGGLWDRGKVYGSQLWPETGANDPFGIDADTPNEFGSSMNYWDPAGIELIEFLRTGDPKWVWDFAIQAYWVQTFLAYLNLGEHFHGNRNGLGVESGGPGCPLDPSTFETTQCTVDGTGGGHWHRTGLGSDDYTYAMSMELAYALRPNLPMRDRFGQAGRTVVDRYDPSIAENLREEFVDVVNITRQVIQHFEMLANCAEFVPGQRGQDCRDRLEQVVSELARDNLAAGILCQGAAGNGDIPGPPSALPTECETPQQFMQNALQYHFFHRYYSTYGDPPDGSVRRALVDAPRVLYQQGLEQAAGGELVVLGDWASGLDCQLTANGTGVTSCTAARDSDGNFFQYGQNQGHTAALLLQAHQLDPTVGLCQITKNAYDDSLLTGDPSEINSGWDQVGHFNQAGWWKGTAQMLQGMAFGVGLYDTCVDNPSADLTITKTDNQSAAAAGSTLTYVIEVANLGPNAVIDAVVTDAFDASRVDVPSSTFRCRPVGPPGTTGPATVCPLDGIAADLIAGVLVSIDVGDSVRFEVSVLIESSAAGVLVNTATVSAPLGFTDPTASNNSATDQTHLGTCSANADEVLSNGTITMPLTVEACSSIEVGPNYRVMPGGALTLRAPLVRMLAGFSVQGGTLDVDPGVPLS